MIKLNSILHAASMCISVQKMVCYSSEELDIAHDQLRRINYTINDYTQSQLRKLHKPTQNFYVNIMCSN